MADYEEEEDEYEPEFDRDQLVEAYHVRFYSDIYMYRNGYRVLSVNSYFGLLA